MPIVDATARVQIPRLPWPTGLYAEIPAWSDLPSGTATGSFSPARESIEESARVVDRRVVREAAQEHVAVSPGVPGQVAPAGGGAVRVDERLGWIEDGLPVLSQVRAGGNVRIAADRQRWGHLRHQVAAVDDAHTVRGLQGANEVRIPHAWRAQRDEPLDRQCRSGERRHCGSQAVACHDQLFPVVCRTADPLTDL